MNGTGDAAAWPLAVYVHWPYCLSKCAYCDFNSRVPPRPLTGADHGRWRRGLVADLVDQLGRLVPPAASGASWRVESLFFGGGTPSLMEPETVAAVIAAAGDRLPLAPDLEVTLEANPETLVGPMGGSIDSGRLEAFRAAGVTRMSLGLQALADPALRLLGRPHNAATGRAAFAAARVVFPRVSADLILGRPGQTPQAWAAELAEMLALEPDHLSVYQLTLGGETPLARRAARGLSGLPDEDTQIALFQETRERLAAAGLRAYEVSNHARPGAECLHNRLTWWGAPLVGVGPGAHGRLWGGSSGSWRSTVGAVDPEGWRTRVETAGSGLAEVLPLSPTERAEELVLTGLRLAEGLDEARLIRWTGLGFEAVLHPEGLETVEAAGLVRWTHRDRPGARVLAATEAGVLVLDRLSALVLGA